MTKYWEKVIQEVLNKDDPNCEFFYTNRRKPLKKAAKKRLVDVSKTRILYLGKKFPGIYFTGRESDCMHYILRGKTNNKIALLLKLSSRTVEFYINKIKNKLNCRTRSDLIERVLESDFEKNRK